MKSLFDNNGNQFNVLEDTDISVNVINCNLKSGQSIIDVKLKNCKFVVCEFTSQDGWTVCVVGFNGYCLNTYTGLSCGFTYFPNTGEIKHQYSSEPNVILTKILSIR